MTNRIAFHLPTSLSCFFGNMKTLEAGLLPSSAVRTAPSTTLRPLRLGNFRKKKKPRLPTSPEVHSLSIMDRDSACCWSRHFSRKCQESWALCSIGLSFYPVKVATGSSTSVLTNCTDCASFYIPMSATGFSSFCYCRIFQRVL